MVRRENRRLRRREKMRKERETRISKNLEVRKAYREKKGIKMRSTSVDRYHDYTDKD
jgi:hypothetical protein